MHLTDEELNEFLDGEAQDRGRIELHLGACLDCAARLEALTSLFAEIESLPELPPSRDLAAAFLRDKPAAAQPERRFDTPPRWLIPTMILQAAFGLLAVVVAAPYAAASLPALQVPSITAWLIQLQDLWSTWTVSAAALQIPAVPTLPVIEVSAMLLALAGAAVLWILGNGLMLRKQDR